MSRSVRRSSGRRAPPSPAATARGPRESRLHRGAPRFPLDGGERVGVLPERRGLRHREMPVAETVRLLGKLNEADRLKIASPAGSPSRAGTRSCGRPEAAPPGRRSDRGCHRRGGSPRAGSGHQRRSGRVTRGGQGLSGHLSAVGPHAGALVQASGANMHDSQGLEPLIRSIPPREGSGWYGSIPWPRGGRPSSGCLMPAKAPDRGREFSTSVGARSAVLLERGHPRPRAAVGSCRSWTAAAGAGGAGGAVIPRAVRPSDP